MKTALICLALAGSFSVILTGQPLANGASGPAGAGRGTPVAEVVGDARAGQAYFNGEGKCNTCHSATGNLKGVGSRYTPTVLQARIVYPRGAAGTRTATVTEAPQDPPLSVTVTPPNGPAVSGTLLTVSDYVVVLKDAAGIPHTFSRNGDTPRLVIKDPLQAHIDLMPKITDTSIHNLTAYLVTLK